MPLVAIVDGQRIESPSLDDEAWAQLRETVKKTGLELVCGQTGYMRKSKLGLKHFVHDAAGCELHAASGRESQEHLATKAALAAAARAAGWEATIEYVGPDREWIADVLIERGSSRIALEAQWSPQAAEEFARRTQRYAGAGLRTIWFVGPKNHGHAAAEDNYKIAGAAEALTINLPGHIFTPRLDWPLQEGALAVFTGRFKKRVEVHPTGTLILAKMARCYACEKWITHWWVNGIVVDIRCGGQGKVEMFMTPPTFRKEAVEPQVSPELLRELSARFAPPVIHRQLKTPEAGEYIGQCCPHCRRTQGDFFLSSVKRTAAIYYLPVSPGVQLERTLTMIPHACDDIGRGRCAASPPSGQTFPVPAEGGRVLFDGFNAGDYEPLPERRPARPEVSRP